MKRILSIILFAAGVFGVGQAKEQLSPDQTLWFTSPAENWAQQALHIGNGYMGASFYGSVNRERFDIAEKTGTTLAVKKYTMVSAREVVSLALRDSYRKKTMSVCSFPIQAFQVLAKVLPHQVLLSIMGVLKRKES